MHPMEASGTSMEASDGKIEALFSAMKAPGWRMNYSKVVFSSCVCGAIMFLLLRE